MARSGLFFDAKDYELLNMVNMILERDRAQPQGYEQKLFDPSLHPHGIKELAVATEIRIAYAVINLLDSLEAGWAEDRILALRALRDEVLYSSSINFRRNTARVLIQIMKDLVRAHGDTKRQLMLAHDFRAAASGKRRVIRRLLRRYYLLEMPESWDQLTFDHHVHDANTKGRKSPTHLIMDAWIKGIRQLTVVYYNHVQPQAVQELLRAAEIMGVTVNVGVEYKARFRGRYVSFIWEPQGLTDYQDMLDFLQERPTQHLMRMGREASEYQSEYVFALLERYNKAHRLDMKLFLGVEVPEISKDELLKFVGAGQASRLHLAELIHRQALPALKERYHELSGRLKLGNGGKHDTEKALQQLAQFYPENIIDIWLGRESNKDLRDPEVINDAWAVPEILRLSAPTLMDWLTGIRPASHISMNLSGLKVEDVLELLYDCEGMISHIELFNLKDFAAGESPHMKAINELQLAVNQGSVVALKRMLRNIIREIGCDLSADASSRCKHFTDILRNIPRLQDFYKSKKLKARIGSDSTSRSSRLHGMGFVCPETLPWHAQKEILNSGDHSMRRTLPLQMEINSQVIYSPRKHLPISDGLARQIRRLPGCARLWYIRIHDWIMHTAFTRCAMPGNIATLGGFHTSKGPAATESDRQHDEEHRKMFYMNTPLKNVIKVLIGFIPAFLTFQYTQSWWLLALLGAPLWFIITGLRNILQAVLGGGGARRSPMLRWNNYVSWTRLCDSLMYTGLSVPLLEFGVRMILLQNILHLNPVDSPLIFFTTLSTINGFYISAHNIYRGFPTTAIIGNLFRSILAIPIAMFYNYLLLEFLHLTGSHDILPILQHGAAIISKVASDTVAGIIEGFADAIDNMRLRHWEYSLKLEQLFRCFARLELLLPEDDVLDLLSRPKDFIRTIGVEARDLEKTIIINALDLMYFWMYQPRARAVLINLARDMTPEEREILGRSQLVLIREKEISQLFVDGIVGRNFSKPLAFYLNQSAKYLEDMAKLTGSKADAPPRPAIG